MPLVPSECKICHKITIKLEYKIKQYQYCSLTCRDKERLLISENVKDRFHTLYEINENGCWIWNKGKSVKGYGEISYLGKQMKAHRVSYSIYKGPITQNLFVCHSCDTPACVNPDHLWLGTSKDNTHDMFNKKRAKREGEHNSRAILTENQVREIKNKLKQGMKSRLLSEMYDVNKGVIDSIKSGKNWKHI